MYSFRKPTKHICLFVLLLIQSTLFKKSFLIFFFILTDGHCNGTASSCFKFRSNMLKNPRKSSIAHDCDHSMQYVFFFVSKVEKNSHLGPRVLSQPLTCEGNIFFVTFSYWSAYCSISLISQCVSDHLENKLISGTRTLI